MLLSLSFVALHAAPVHAQQQPSPSGYAIPTESTASPYADTAFPDQTFYALIALSAGLAIIGLVLVYWESSPRHLAVRSHDARTHGIPIRRAIPVPVRIRQRPL